MSSSRKELAGSVIALGATITAAMDDAPGFVPCGTPAQVIISAIRCGAEGDAEAIGQTIQQVQGFIGHVSEHRGVTAHEPASTDGLAPAQTKLAQKLVSLALAKNADELSPAETEWLYRSLAALEPGNTTAESLLAEA